LKNGKCYRRRVTIAKGHPKKPLSRFEIEEKFRSCAKGISPDKAQRFIAMLWSIEKISTLGPWLRLLRVPGR